VGVAQRGEELATKQQAHGLDREQVAGAAMEARTIAREAAGGDDRVHVRVEAQVARPRVEHERGAERRIEAALAELEERPRRSAEERVEHHARRVLRERPQLGRQREDDVEVADIEHVLAALLDPLLRRERLALRTVPIATGIVSRVLVVARFTVIEVPSERSRATSRDVRQHPLLRAGETVLRFELQAMRPHDRADAEPCAPGLRRARGHCLRRPGSPGSRSSGLGVSRISTVETRV